MCSSHHTAAHFAAEFDDGHSQRRAFRRVGASAQFIKKYQRAVIALANHIHNGAHMAGEGGKALGNGLLIADIRQDRIKSRKGAAVPCRNMQAALCHQRQKADGLQRHGFTAGIGAGDDHAVKILAQPHGNRHNRLGVDQRMPGISQLHNTLIIHDRCPGPHPVGKLCLCEDHIQLGQHPHIQLNILPVGSCFRRKLRKDPLDLLAFLDLQLPQGIVRVHSGHRLHKISRAGGGHIVNQAGHVRPVLTLDGHHIAAVTDGDDGIPQIFGIGRRRDDLLQAILDLSSLDAHMAADVTKGSRRIVRDLLFRQNRTADAVFQIFVGGQRHKKCIQNRLLVILGHITLDIPGTTQNTCDSQQLHRLQRTAPLRPFQRCGYIDHTGKRGVSLPGAKVGSGGGLIQQQLHLLQIGDGTQPQAA